MRAAKCTLSGAKRAGWEIGSNPGSSLMSCLTMPPCKGALALCALVALLSGADAFSLLPGVPLHSLAPARAQACAPRFSGAHGSVRARATARWACVSVNPDLDQRKNVDLYEGLADPAPEKSTHVMATMPEVLSPAGGWPQLRCQPPDHPVRSCCRKCTPPI